jgi:integrase/recombinase XerD
MSDHYEKMLESGKRYIEKLEITPKNKNLILQFVEQLSAEGLTPIRQTKYLYAFGKISELLDGKDFSKLTKQDITKYCSKVNNADYTEWTKRDFRIMIKRFMKWLREQEGQTFDKHQYPEEVKWISTSMKNNRQKLPNELLIIDDVKKLADATNNLRDRCFVLMLYESGARIGELINLTLKDIEPDKYGIKVTLFGKTGARKIRLIASAPALNMWIQQSHPDRDNKNSMLFCGLWAKKKGKDVEYQTFRYMLQDLAKKAKITKPVNPHNFRHSRATELAKQFTEAQLCQYMGWIMGSREAATYVHLSGRDMDGAILKLNGFEQEEKQESQFKATKCPRCGIMNSPESKACPHCGIPLDIQSVMDYEIASKTALKQHEDIKTFDDLLKAYSSLEEKIKNLEKGK